MVPMVVGRPRVGGGGEGATLILADEVFVCRNAYTCCKK